MLITGTQQLAANTINVAHIQSLALVWNRICFIRALKRYDVQDRCRRRRLCVNSTPKLTRGSERKIEVTVRFTDTQPAWSCLSCVSLRDSKVYVAADKRCEHGCRPQNRTYRQQRDITVSENPRNRKSAGNQVPKRQ